MLLRIYVVLALFALAGCTASAIGSDSGDQGVGTGGTGGTGGAQLALDFLGPKPLVLDPGESELVSVVVSPSMPAQTVRFALVAGTDPVADAALDRTEATTDDDGVATVTLTAPSIPATFNLRALVGTHQKVLEVSVLASGEEALVVQPSYAGERIVTEWVAAVYDDGRICADLEGNPPIGSNAARSITAPFDGPIRFDNVTVGKPLAVTLRAGHFAGGCSGVEAVVEGRSNSVLVTVTNRPIQLDQSSVLLRLGLSGQETALSTAMESVIDAARAAVLGGAQSDSEALLDAMQEEAASGTSCSSFESARGANGWEVELATGLGIAATSSIRDDLAEWLAAGVPTLARDDAFVGNLAPETGVVGRANLTLTSVTDFRPADAGFERSVETTWTADAGDNVVLGTTLTFNPSAWLVLAAQEPATMDEPDASTLAAALALRGARCETVAATLTAHGQGPGQSCSDCDVACTRTLCERGVARLVARASAALADEPAELRLAATGLAEVGEQAEVQTLAGSWVGALDAASQASELAGDLEAEGAY